MLPFSFQSYRDLSFVSRDGLALVLSHLTQLVVERFPRLQDTVRSQLMWLIKELVRANVTGTDTLIWNLMRQIAGGDVTAKNLWLADSLVELLTEQRYFCLFNTLFFKFSVSTHQFICALYFFYDQVVD